MTIEEVRTNPLHLARMAEVLTDPLVQDVLKAIEESEALIEPATNADPIVSVRLLSRQTGFQAYRTKLYESAIHYVPEQPAPDATYKDDN